MKIDVECVDRNGTSAEVTIDLDYVFDADEARSWLENELYTWSLKNKTDFDTTDFVVPKWDDIIKEVEREGEGQYETVL